jgi:hypothetical protein
MHFTRSVFALTCGLCLGIGAAAPASAYLIVDSRSTSLRVKAETNNNTEDTRSETDPFEDFSDFIFVARPGSGTPQSEAFAEQTVTFGGTGDELVIEAFGSSNTNVQRDSSGSDPFDADGISSTSFTFSVEQPALYDIEVASLSASAVATEDGEARADAGVLLYYRELGDFITLYESSEAEDSFGSSTGGSVGSAQGVLAPGIDYTFSVSSVTDSALGGNQRGSASALASFDVTFTLVPEPGALGLLLAGVPLVLRRRRGASTSAAATR